MGLHHKDIAVEFFFLEGHHFITSNRIGSFEVDTKKIDFHELIHGTKPTSHD
jgi:hypothetical protein